MCSNYCVIMSHLLDMVNMLWNFVCRRSVFVSVTAALDGSRRHVTALRYFTASGVEAMFTRCFGELRRHATQPRLSSLSMRRGRCVFLGATLNPGLNPRWFPRPSLVKLHKKSYTNPGHKENVSS